MSLVVGIKHKGDVWIGSDSAATANKQMDLLSTPKQFRIGNKKEFLVGCVGNIRLNQVMEFHFFPPEHSKSKDAYKYMVTDFIPAFRSCMKENDSVIFEKGACLMEGSVLVAYKKEIFEIQDNWQISINSLPFTAIGSAYPNAYGALFALQQTDYSPEEKLRIALEVGERFVVDVCSPFHIEKL